MALENWQIGAIVGGIVFIVGLVGVVIWAIIHFSSSGSSGPSKLPTPVGEMNPVSGPYPSYNAIPGVYSTGHISETKYPEKELYSEYGYRAVYVKSGEVVDRDKSSGIKWNEFIYKVMAYEVDEREDSGFKFKIPKQKSSLIASNVEYELVSTVYDNPDGNGTPLYTELILGRVASEGVSELTILETSDKADNKVLIS